MPVGFVLSPRRPRRHAYGPFLDMAPPLFFVAVMKNKPFCPLSQWFRYQTGNPESNLDKPIKTRMVFTKTNNQLLGTLNNSTR